MKRFCVLAILVAFVVGGHVPGGEKTDRPLDKDFLVKAAICNNAEIEISKLASKRSNSDKVKEFASTLQKEHKEAFDKLGELMKTHKLGVAVGFEKETRDEVKRLSSLEGNDFDRAFLQHMIRAHKKAVSIFENQQKNGEVADISRYAKEMLPDLQKHLRRAEELAKTTAP